MNYLYNGNPQEEERFNYAYRNLVKGKNFPGDFNDIDCVAVDKAISLIRHGCPGDAAAELKRRSLGTLRKVLEHLQVKE